VPAKAATVERAETIKVFFIELILIDLFMQKVPVSSRIEEREEGGE
jgi:hypothetical protein